MLYILYASKNYTSLKMFAARSESKNPIKALRKLKGQNPKLFNGNYYLFIHTVYPYVDSMYKPVGFVGCYDEAFQEVI